MILICWSFNTKWNDANINSDILFSCYICDNASWLNYKTDFISSFEKIGFCQRAGGQSFGPFYIYR